MEAQDTTKVRLIEAAGEEFAGKGFDCARVRTICERAGANVAAINYHFGDKEQLYVETVLDAHRCGLEAPEAEAAMPPLPADQLRCFIHHFLCHVLAIHHPEDWRHRLMLREMLHPTSASDVLIREAIRPKFERLQGILRQFCPAADERKLNALAFSVIGQCLYYRMGRPFAERLIGSEAFESLDLNFLTDHITSICLAALGCSPPLNDAGEPSPDASSVVTA
jgi:TetR/AcrR family transcriptional regulator, regulator of cefoperazone and chloramphenicol sensitivity